MAKPILAFYINIGNLNAQDVHEYINSVKENIGDFNEEYHKFVIPVKNQDTKIELLSPNIIVSDNKEISKLFKIQKRLFFETEQLLKRMPYLSKNILLIEKTMIS